MGAHNSVVGADQGFLAPSWDQESVRDSVHEDSASAASRQVNDHGRVSGTHTVNSNDEFTAHWASLQQGLLGGAGGCGCDGGGAGAQVGPGTDEAVVGAGLGGPASVVGLLVQQVGELACPVAVAAEDVE